MARKSNQGTSEKEMVNPSDEANASRNETSDILTVYLINRSVYIGCMRIKMI